MELVELDVGNINSPFWDKTYIRNFPILSKYLPLSPPHAILVFPN